MAQKRNLKPFFILASASPRRRSILKAAGYHFRVAPSHVKETVPWGLSPASIVKILAIKKARWSAQRNPTALTLGADTLVFLGRKSIGKPRDAAHARQILRALSGRWQSVWTGVAVSWAGGKKVVAGARCSRVKIRRLSEGEIEAASKKHLDKAGAYSVQSKNDDFVVKLKGDYDNVVGLPMRVVRPLLRRGAAGQALTKTI